MAKGSFNRSLKRMLPAILLVYMVLLGGTSVGELHPVIRLTTSLIVLGLLIAWTLGPARSSDRIDAAVLVSLLLFIATCLTSQLMRQSFDAAWMATGFASALVVGRRALHDPGTRKLLLGAMAALSLILVLITAARWLPMTVAWTAASGVPPPLDLAYPSAPWGHRHDTALLLVILAPAWLAFTGHRAGLVIAIGAWVLTTVLVVVDGSRNLWFAIGVASLALAWGRWGGRRLLTRRVLVPAAALGVLLAAFLSVALLDRVLNFRTIGARNELWEGSIQAWLADALTGYGPGSFPWVLQTTEYFASNGWAPRHPDSALFQLLPEAGLVGLAAAAILLGAIVPRIRLSDPSGWALVCFLVAGVAANPTDFGFLIAVAIAWLAYSTPVASVQAPLAHGSRRRHDARPIAIATLGLAAAVSLTHVSAFIGEVQAWRAGRAMEVGELATASESMASAISLDPSMAYYHRIGGLIEWSQRGAEEAIPALTRAVGINPFDDLAWRQLAAAQAQSGDEDGAIRSAEMALLRQRSDIINLLFTAQIISDTGQSGRALSLVAEAVQSWPTLASSSSWPQYLARIRQTDAAVLAAGIDRWQQGLPSRLPQRTQPVWLAAIGDRPDLREAAIKAATEPPQLVEALSAALACNGSRAERLLREADPSSVYQPLYWQLRVALASMPGADPDPRASATLDAMSGKRSPSAPEIGFLDEGTAPGFSIDNWGYRRRTIAFPGLAESVPRPKDNWTDDLAGTARCHS